MDQSNFEKYYILVRFIEDQKFDVLRLKKAINSINAISDIKEWDQTSCIDVLWNGSTYPANIIQFGENKKEMDVLIDKLGDGDIALPDIPVIQEPLESQTIRKGVIEESSTISLKKRKVDASSGPKNDAANNILKEVKKKLISQADACTKCISLHEKCNLLNSEKSTLLFKVNEQAQRISHLENKVEKLKAKNARRKEKCKQLSLLQVKEEETLIGSSLRVPTNKLNMCRSGGYAKFVGDLLEVVFGRDVLSVSVLKGIKGVSKKSNILDANKIKDIQLFVSTKFNVDQALVRAAIRRKLNVVDRPVKEITPMNV